MAKGVRDVRMVQEQLHLVLKMTTDETLKQKGKELDTLIETWIEGILQKEMRTYQSNYMFEARLLIKFKDFLNSIDKGNLPMTPGVRDVSKDYLEQWAALKAQLSDIKQKEVPQLNAQLQQVGLPQLYWPKP